MRRVLCLSVLPCFFALACSESDTTSQPATDAGSSDTPTTDTPTTDTPTTDTPTTDTPTTDSPPNDSSPADVVDPDGDVGVDASPPVCTSGSGAFPRALDLPGAEPNGVFDPNLALDPATGRLWISYSGVTGPAGSGLVSTHLAYSDDSGTTWFEAGVVNSATLVPQDQQPSNLAMPNGHWSHEVSAIVHDPGASPGERWRLMWHRYLHIDDEDPTTTDDRRFEHGWIAQRTASTPEGLMTAPERKLFSSFAYHFASETEAYNDRSEGGLPEKRFDTDPNLGGCLAFSEPGVLAFGGDLYVAMFCFRDASHQDIVLVRLSHATNTWSYVSTLLTTADAQAIAPELMGFNGADLFDLQGGQRLIVTPMAGAYLGCIEYEVNLGTGTLTDTNGDGPDAIHAIPKNPDPGVYQTGACAFQEGSTTGIIVGDTYVTGVQFRLIATGETH